jgi:two-component system OmpR family sensor kinase
VDATLRDDDDVSPRVRKRLVAVAEAAAQMRRLTDNLLLLARAGQPLELDLFVVDLSPVLSRLRALYEELGRERGVTLTIARCDAVRVYGNPDQIQRIIANLIENAIRYTPAGGQVSVTCGVDRTSVNVRVRDTGIGIAETDRHRVFERFWRSDPARSDGAGAGLGLAVARALSERHGGAIALSSELGKGSTFTFSLPRR